MGVFNFKRFAVVNERSAMKVNTDGVLLGAAMTILPTDRAVLDVGTGTGTIALMVAQRVAQLCNSESCPCHPELVSGSSERTGMQMLKQVQHDVEEVQHDVEEVQHDVEKVQYDVEKIQYGKAWAQGGVEKALDNLRIDAIDIDEASAAEAAMNFVNSPWAAFLKAHHQSLEDFAMTTDRRYDLIFSNPPYFEDSLPAPEERRCNARHTVGLSYRELLDFASERLTETGRFSIVLPADQEAPLARYARMKGLHLFRIMRVRTVPRKTPGRIIAEFSRRRCPDFEDVALTIQNEGKYTEEYLSLTRDFYLFA